LQLLCHYRLPVRGRAVRLFTAATDLPADADPIVKAAGGLCVGRGLKTGTVGEPNCIKPVIPFETPNAGVAAEQT